LPGGRRVVRRFTGQRDLAAFGGRPLANDNPDGFQCRLVCARFGSLAAGVAHYTPHTRTFDGTNFGHDHPVYRLVIVVDGGLVVRIADEEFTLGPGVGLLIPGDEPCTFEVTTVTTRIHVDISADDPAFAPLLQAARPQIWPGNSTLLDAFAAFVGSLLKRERSSQLWSDRQAVQSVFEAMVTAMLSAIPASRRDDTFGTDYREAAMRYIRAHCADPRLSPRAVAAALGISVRSLQRVFEDEMSVAQWISHYRVQQAMNYLQDPRTGTLTVSEIAERCGFGSTVALRRAVISATGLPPTVLRDQPLVVSP
jgi:AraC-like DNA-binding protein